MNYLVPLDFSDHSKAAAQYAAQLTKIWEGNLHLTHIIVPIEDEPSYLSVKTLQVKRNTVFELFNYQEELRRKYQVRTSSDMLKGNLAVQIRKTVAREKSDIVVMGRQGATGLRNFLYGSNTMAVIENSAVPVLVVADGITFEPFKHITYYTTFDPAELNDIKSLLKISRKFDAKFTLVSVNSNVSAQAKLEFFSAIQVMGIKEFVQASISHEHSIAEGLLEFCKEESVDLLSLCTSSKDLVRSLAGRSLTGEFVFDVNNAVLFLPH